MNTNLDPRSKARLIAFYLPQYHPIPENDEWWGKGFTEWTNVVKAKPIFRGHYQPHIPSELNFYDLRIPEVQEQQIELASEYGIYGFCYYHYWFNGRRLLEKPLDNIINTGKQNFPFCICWANENWSRRWDGGDSEILIRQNYNYEDHIRHASHLMKYLSNDRYIRINDKPLFLIYRSKLIPEIKNVIDLYRKQFIQLGIGEVYICRVESFPDEHVEPLTDGFDANVEFQPNSSNMGQRLKASLFRRMFSKFGFCKNVYNLNYIFNYENIIKVKNEIMCKYKKYPCVTPMWDNSARRKNGAVIIQGSTPELYEQWLKNVIKSFNPYTPEENFIFINAWNEWAEGNHLEPCERWGRAYLEATKSALLYPGFDSDSP